MDFVRRIIARVPFGRTGTEWVVEARAGADARYPVMILPPDAPSTSSGFPLSREEAQALLEALDDALNFDPDSYVQVRVREGLRNRYTYRDPSGTLAVGDHVQVPFGASNRLRMGEVIALGKGEYDGPVKDVAARFVTEPLAA